MGDEREFSRRRMMGLGGLAIAAAGIAGGWALVRRDRFEGATLTAPEALEAVRAGELLLVDIRRPDEWASTGIPEGAEPLDMRRDDFVEALEALAGGTDRPVALICARGVRSDRMSAALEAAGFTTVADVSEGMLGSSAGPGWLARGLPVARP
ncbi:rhodanese-like domain-containing protein [Jannaschia ovalis]|uniref:Rhodanese-like domain-containing protein n=1 Tax=Jannaschia ovalis TaxID=3038773 RepID=A0ABY8LBI2_9RHOB|nr:rhodanese-like domain-containing protein [Jannaschia sp. GRR-S6-38]WGH78636.1 rhodanese-like domain-containing protein [Jannaschia sp. GRR-S6-38]